MTVWTYLCVFSLLVGCCSCDQHGDFNVDKLADSVDMDDNGTITDEEVAAFFEKIRGSSATLTRCPFVQNMHKYTGGSEMQLSVLYDIMQTEDVNSVTLAEFKLALMGQANQEEISLAQFEIQMSHVMTRVIRALEKPYDNTGSLNMWKYDEFDVNRLALETDANADGLFTRKEISVSIRALDNDGNGAIYMCEFVNSMAAYKVHPATATKLYKELFYVRDVTWADVDSDFLLSSMNGDENQVVTRDEFIEWFTEKNLLGAGLRLSPDGALIGDKNGGARTYSIPLYSLVLFSLVIIAFFKY